MESQNSLKPGRKAEQWIGLSLCAAVMVISAIEHFVHNRQAYSGNLAPDWLTFIAPGIAAAGIIRLKPKWYRIQRTLRWIGLFLMVWVANGLPLDLLRLTPLIPLEIDWPGLITKTMALVVVILLARIALASPTEAESIRPATWYGYAAFLLALPYPFLRTCWALGGRLGLMQPGAAGQGFLPWLASVPWILAAALSLLLISARSRMPRKLLLSAGWFATAVVAMVGPAACWSLVTKLVTGADLGLEADMKTWVPCLFYGSWLLWAIAAGAATRSYQLRSAGNLP